MKKYILATLLIGLSFFGFGQTTKVLNTDDGSKMVTINADGTTSATFTTAEWATMSKVVPTSNLARVCIHIANRHEDCTGGLGFRCGIFDCPPPPSITTPAGQERIQPADIQLSGSDVLVTFLNSVDWDYLAN